MRVSMRESAGPPPDASESASRVAIPESETGLRFAEVLRSFGRELDRGDQGMKSAIGALAGRGDLAPSTLIALQIGVYRYGSAIDLASRFVDRATSAIKTVVQANGQ